MKKSAADLKSAVDRADRLKIRRRADGQAACWQLD
jgi:hypothetical protein